MHARTYLFNGVIHAYMVLSFENINLYIVIYIYIFESEARLCFATRKVYYRLLYKANLYVDSQVLYYVMYSFMFFIDVFGLLHL